MANSDFGAQSYKSGPSQSAGPSANAAPPTVGNAPVRHDTDARGVGQESRPPTGGGGGGGRRPVPSQQPNDYVPNHPFQSPGRSTVRGRELVGRSNVRELLSERFTGARLWSGSRRVDEMVDQVMAQATSGALRTSVLGEDIENAPAAQTQDFVRCDCENILSADRQTVLEQVHEMLKPGGWLAITDLVTENISSWIDHSQHNEALQRLCVERGYTYPSAAWSFDDYRECLEEVGFADVDFVLGQRLSSAIRLVTVVALKPVRPSIIRQKRVSLSHGLGNARRDRTQTPTPPKTGSRTGDQPAPTRTAPRPDRDGGAAAGGASPAPAPLPGAAMGNNPNARRRGQ